MSKPSVIAIDGPAAAGKTTVGYMLASELGYLYFDTGVMYRAVTLEAIQRGIPIEDEAAVVAIAHAVRIDVKEPAVDDGRLATVCIDDRDVTFKLRISEVDAAVSMTAAYPEVRRELVQQQRRIAAKGRVVMVGRDIGTVVVPEADLKLYLEADLETRARRRWEELHKAGRDDSYEEVLTSMARRDKLDAEREVSPLRAAEDAIHIDTSNHIAEDVLRMTLKIIEQMNGS